MKKNLNVKIFVSNRIDQLSEYIENDIYVPVNCGACYSNSTTSDILGDNTGYNISKNRMSFCELTVLYWAWKNQKADYYGLCHYRRYLGCAENISTENIAYDECNAGCLVADCINYDSISKFGFDQDSIYKLVDKCDAVFIKPIDLRDHKIKSNYEAMKRAPKYHDIKDMDLALEILYKKYPKMAKTAKKYMNDYNFSYLYNCFIMNAKLFNAFCEWLFSILFELNSKLDISKYDISKYRTPGTIAERLLGIWILHLKEQKIYKIKEVPLVFIRDVNKMKTLKPAYKSNNIAITSNFNNNYVPVFAVFLRSAISHISSDYNYDFIVLSSDVSEKSKELLAEIIKEKPNVSLRYINPHWALEGIQKKVGIDCYSEDLYYRVVIPYILENYDKVLVVDADTICREDLKNLYNTNLTNYLAGGIIDVVFQGWLTMFPDRYSYAKNYMKMSDPFNYINTGVILLNCKDFRSQYSLDYLRDFIIKHMNHVMVWEQDMLNMLLKDKILYLDRKWNSFTTPNDVLKESVIKAPLESYEAWKFGRESNRGIVHYANTPKPWQDFMSDMAASWWHYARNTPYYEYFLQNIQVKYDYIATLKNIHDYRKNRFRYYKYRILSNILFGKIREKYKTKKKIYKKLLQSIDDIKS